MRDPAYRGLSTNMAPGLELLQEELRLDPAWADRVKNHQEALVVLLLTDGEVHDTARIRTALHGQEGLQTMGAHVMTAVFGKRQNYMLEATGDKTFAANNTRELINGINAQAEMVKRGGRRFGTRSI